MQNANPNPPRPPAPSPTLKPTLDSKGQPPKSRLPTPDSYARFLLDRHQHTS